MLRPFNPADLVGLLFLQATAPPNLACSRQALAAGGSRALLLASLIGEWLPVRNGRHVWVLSRRGLAIGVVSTRRGRGQGSWEIDRLQIARGKEPACAELLEGLALTLGRAGAQRLFLRLAEGSPLEEPAQKAGFCPLVSEELYLRPRGTPSPPAPAAEAALRSAQEADAFNLFRLYNMVVPAPVRQAHGLALRDWQGSRDLCEGGSLEEALVLPKDGELAGAVAVSQGARQRRMMDLLARPSDRAAAEALIGAAVVGHGQRSALLCLLPEYLWSMAPVLEEHGFQCHGSFFLHVRPVVARMRRPGLLPVGA